LSDAEWGISGSVQKINKELKREDYGKEEE
jgi:hypothetical protein